MPHPHPPVLLSIPSPPPPPPILQGIAGGFGSKWSTPPWTDGSGTLGSISLLVRLSYVPFIPFLLPLPSASSLLLMKHTAPNEGEVCSRVSDQDARRVDQNIFQQVCHLILNSLITIHTHTHLHKHTHTHTHTHIRTYTLPPLKIHVHSK